jgi:hypothetical protein
MVRRRAFLAVALAAAFAATVAGCGVLRSLFQEEEALRVGGEWPALLAAIRAFERRIGFDETPNFRSLSEAQDEHAFCGHASRFYLPYSYEDPAIRWIEVGSREQCLEGADGADVFFGTVEALGESESPVTPAMLASPLERFLYLVLHEDCHDQFELPYGIEEPLCNILAFRAMVAFSEERFGRGTPEHAAARRYAERETSHTHLAKAYYERLEALYSRFERGELPEGALILERGRIFAAAERSLARERGSMNNVVIANDMTYSRYFPSLERVFEALGGDLARAVAFFKRVDRSKPSRRAFLEQSGLATEASVEFVRGYEAAVARTIERELERERRATPASR